MSGDQGEIAAALNVIRELVSVQTLPVACVPEILATLCQWVLWFPLIP
jgi:hypothetical protein